MIGTINICTIPHCATSSTCGYWLGIIHIRWIASRGLLELVVEIGCGLLELVVLCELLKLIVEIVRWIASWGLLQLVVEIGCGLLVLVVEILCWLYVIGRGLLKLLCGLLELLVVEIGGWIASSGLLIYLCLLLDRCDISSRPVYLSAIDRIYIVLI